MTDPCPCPKLDDIYRRSKLGWVWRFCSASSIVISATPLKEAGILSTDTTRTNVRETAVENLQELTKEDIRVYW